MGFFQKINKIWSGADFWDKSENQQQRQNFARQDEEERRRRQQQAANAAISHSPGVVNAPIDGGGGPTAPPQRPPSSILTLGDLNMGKPPATTPTFNPHQPLQKAQPTGISGFLHKATHNGITNAVGDAAKGLVGITTALPKLAVNEVRYGAGRVTGNEAAAQHAADLGRENLNTLKSIPQGIAAASYQLGESVNPAGGDVYQREHTFTGAPRFLFGDQPVPSLQKQYKQNVAEKGKGYAGASAALAVLMDVVGAKGLTKAPTILSKVRRGGPAAAEEAAVTAAEDVAPAVEGAVPTTTVTPTVAPSTPPTSTPVINATPAYLRKADRQATESAQAVADAADAAKDPLNRPAFQHRQDIQRVVDEGQNKLDEFINDHPDASLTDIETARTAIENEVVSNVKTLQDARYGPTAPTIPDPTDVRALAKATDGTPAVTSAAPMADFSKAINAPLRKAEPVTAPAVETPTAPATTDAAGNPALVSDAERARQLTAEGAPPSPAPSPVAATEDQLATSADRTARQQVGTETPAPRTRQQMINQVDDQALQDELVNLAPPKEQVNLEATNNAAKATINNMSDEQLVASYSNALRLESPDDLFRGLAASRRLQGIGTDEARAAVRNITDAISEQSSKSGLWQRASQILFEDMPTDMKADYLMKKMAQAGADLTDADRQMLVTLLSNADALAERLNNLQDEARGLMDSGAINNKSMADTTRQRVGELTREIQATARQKELASGQAWDFYRNHLPNNPLGKRFGEVGRTMMLSAPSGRAFDILSTGITTADDLLTRGVSNLVGKTLNKVPGVSRGTFSDTVIAPRKLVKGAVEGTKNFMDALRGRSRVEDFMTESRRATRGDIQGGGAVRRVVRAATNLPTELTRGLREEELFRQGMQEAAQQGLKGSARRAYAELRAAVPDPEQLHDAIEIHMKANMLHNNRVSRFLNGVAQSLDRGGNGWLAAPIRNQIIPFTSWIGGFIHRTLTDKNVLYNTYKVLDSARKADAQGVIDNVSKLAVNGGEAYAAGMLLTKMGVLTNEDANGNKFGGVYFHIGDRYIPVAAAGTVSVPIILGNALDQAQHAHENGQSPMGVFTNAVITNTLKNAGIQSTFGGGNTLQTTISSLTDDKGSATDALAQYVGDFVRQYIPAAGSDVNALLDYSHLNPTHEAPNTKVVKENPATGRDVTDTIPSEIAKTMAKIPIASQGLPRDESKPARDLVDRVLHGSHETVQMAQDKQVKLTDQQEKAARKKDQVPDTLEGIQARVEDGKFDLAISGYKQQLSDLEKNKEAPESKKQKLRDDMKRVQVTRDNGFGPDVIALYDKTSLSEWRAMANSDSEDYDPETAGLLMSYDKKLADAGVSKSTKAGDHPKFFEAKKKEKKKRTGPGYGPNGEKLPSIVTDIGLVGDAPAFTGFKPQSANFGAPQSAIPQLEKVPQYSRQLKKIGVRRGR